MLTSTFRTLVKKIKMKINDKFKVKKKSTFKV